MRVRTCVRVRVCTCVCECVRVCWAVWPSGQVGAPVQTCANVQRKHGRSLFTYVQPPVTPQGDAALPLPTQPPLPLAPGAPARLQIRPAFVQGLERNLMLRRTCRADCCRRSLRSGHDVWRFCVVCGSSLKGSIENRQAGDAMERHMQSWHPGYLLIDVDESYHANAGVRRFVA